MSGEPEETGKPKGWKRIAGKAVRSILITLLLLLLLALSSAFIWTWEFAFHVIAGPFIHAWKNLPPFFSQWRSALLPLSCLAFAIMLAHRFIRWWIKTQEIRMTWRAGHTSAAAALILLGSAAAIAMSGITHQAAWLVSSPWLESNRRTEYTVAINNARQILLALFEYETEHNRYPDALEEALKAADCPPRMLWVETGPDRVREPFIFLKPGRPSTGLIEAVLVSPVIHNIDKVAVGYSDGSVRTMTHKAWLRLKEEIHAANE